MFVHARCSRLCVLALLNVCINTFGTEMIQPISLVASGFFDESRREKLCRKKAEKFNQSQQHRFGRSVRLNLVQNHE